MLKKYDYSIHYCIGKCPDMYYYYSRTYKVCRNHNKQWDASQIGRGAVIDVPTEGCYFLLYLSVDLVISGWAFSHAPLFIPRYYQVVSFWSWSLKIFRQSGFTIYSISRYVLYLLKLHCTKTHYAMRIYLMDRDKKCSFFFLHKLWLVCI